MTGQASGEGVRVILRPGRAREWLGRRVEVLSLWHHAVLVELSVQLAVDPALPA